MMILFVNLSVRAPRRTSLWLICLAKSDQIGAALAEGSRRYLWPIIFDRSVVRCVRIACCWPAGDVRREIDLVLLLLLSWLGRKESKCFENERALPLVLYWTLRNRRRAVAATANAGAPLLRQVQSTCDLIVE